MTDFTIKPYDRLEQLHESATDAFCELVNRTLETSDIVRISLSGGSTPKRLYELLSKRDLPWDKIHWFWGDERNVPHDDLESNARMVREALLDRVGAADENIHTVPVNIQDPASAAMAYETTLREHFPLADFPRWDLALLGMGDDAHTASLFPETKALDQLERWFVENWVEKFNAFRYTLTAPAINSAKQSWFLVAGSDKREALSQVLTGPTYPRLLPAQSICPTRWFVTKDACSMA
jgi:6-phosphogluconolactonase